MPGRWQQVSVIAQENLKLAAFLFYHMQKCTFDWDVMGICMHKFCLLGRQKGLKDNYNPYLVEVVEIHAHHAIVGGAGRIEESVAPPREGLHGHDHGVGAVFFDDRGGLAELPCAGSHGGGISA